MSLNMICVLLYISDFSILPSIAKASTSRLRRAVYHPIIVWLNSYWGVIIYKIVIYFLLTLRIAIYMIVLIVLLNSMSCQLWNVIKFGFSIFEFISKAETLHLPMKFMSVPWERLRDIVSNHYTWRDIGYFWCAFSD